VTSFPIRMNQIAERMYGRRQRYEPQRAGGAFDGYKSGTDLLIGALHSNDLQGSDDYERGDAVNSVNPDPPYVSKTGDKNLRSGGLMDDGYAAFAFRDMAQELELPEPEGERISGPEQVRYLQRVMRELDRRKVQRELTEQEEELLQSIPEFISRRTGG